MPAIYKHLSPDSMAGGDGWGNFNNRMGRSGSKKLNEPCTRQYVGSECAPGLICQDGKCKDKKDSKFFYRTGKAYDTFQKYRPRGLSRQGLSLGFKSFGGKSRRKSRKKRRRSRKRRR